MTFNDLNKIADFDKSNVAAFLSAAAVIRKGGEQVLGISTPAPGALIPGM